MQVPIRLYKRHDLDLIYLYNHKDFSLTKALKLALYGYVNKEKFFINTPKDIQEITSNSNKKSIYFRLILNDETDKDIIEFISKMPSGYRNSMIKNLFRQYLNGPNLLGYYIDINQANNDCNNFKELDFYEKSKTVKNYKTITQNKVVNCSVSVFKKKTHMNQKSLFDMNAEELKETVFNSSFNEIEERLDEEKLKNKDIDEDILEKQEANKIKNEVFEDKIKKSNKNKKPKKEIVSDMNEDTTLSDNDDFDMFAQIAESMKSFM